jgi:transposase
MNTPKRIDLTPQQLDALLKRVEAGTLQDGDYEIIKGMAETLSILSQALDNKNTSIKRLLKLIFCDSTEKTANVLKRDKAGGKPIRQSPTALTRATEHQGLPEAGRVG